MTTNLDRQISVAATVRTAAATREGQLKKLAASQWLPDTRLPQPSTQHDADGRPLPMGMVAVNRGAVSYDIDLAQAVPHLMARYNATLEQVVEHDPKLTEQYRKSLIAEAEAAHEAGKDLPPGITRLQGGPTVSWKPDKRVDALAEVANMVGAGELDLIEMLCTTPDPVSVAGEAL